MMTTTAWLEGLLPLCRRLEHRRDPGCPDADGDGVTDQVEGTEDEDDDDQPASLGTMTTLCMVVGKQCFFRDGVSTKRTYEFR